MNSRVLKTLWAMVAVAMATVLTMSLVVSAMNTKKNKISKEDKEGYCLVHQTLGPVLGYSKASGVKIIEKEGLAFKSFDGGDTLLPYEDWRLPAEKRAEYLALRLSLDEIAGLMLYSPQNKLFTADLSDAQKKFLLEDNVRHVLVSTVKNPETAARWNNNVQALIEGEGHGIPANNSSDPRHSAFEDAEFAPGSSGDLSLWSHLTGLAATFSPETVYEFARIARAEYRALGLTTALSPQADLGTDPRWYRYSSTFGNDPQLVADLVRAYCDGFQTASNSKGWGEGSVNAMVKHWPGGGSGEGGRDAHYGNGKYAVYPGGCFKVHKYPFIHGAFDLKGGTSKAAAVMPYYTISYNQTSENVGNSFNFEIVTEQLRQDVGYEGVVCTDWVITADQKDPGKHYAKPWGVETLTVAQRHYKALMAGVDQFGGNDEKAPVVEAYKMGCKEHGEAWMRKRMELSAKRLLMNIFRTGLFENPYVDIENTRKTVGNQEWMQKGYNQQLQSIVMLKNHNNVLPLKKHKTKVYVPLRHVAKTRNFWGGWSEPRDYNPVAEQLAAKYYQAVTSPDQADIAIVFVESPKSHRMGYDPFDVAKGGNGYIPISLQYRPYKAVSVRKTSIAGDPAEPTANRSYWNKEVYAYNECDLDMVEATRKAMGKKTVIVVVAMSNPMVMSELEPLSDAILIGFSVQTQAFLDLIFGATEPSGLLPFEMPASMEAIEKHCEDKPHDIEPYCDSDNNIYKFAFGLNWRGVIKDKRTKRYAFV